MAVCNHLFKILQPTGLLKASEKAFARVEISKRCGCACHVTGILCGVGFSLVFFFTKLLTFNDNGGMWVVVRHQRFRDATTTTRR